MLRHNSAELGNDGSHSQFLRQFRLADVKCAEFAGSYEARGCDVQHVQRAASNRGSVMSRQRLGGR